MLRDWTKSDKINSLKADAERFFTRLIMKVDDYGCFYADTRLLKADLFPLLLDNIREADLLRWMAECQKAGLIVLYENANKKYLQILDFRQRLDKARSKFPLPASTDLPELVNEFQAEREVEPEPEIEKKLTPKGVEETVVSSPSHQESYSKILKNKVAISSFIKKNQPDFIEPYYDLWNLFAAEKSLAKISKISNSRKRKFKVRYNEQAFDFLAILKKASQSEFLLTGKWFGFDWIFENDSNYLKVMEGSYDKNNEPGAVKTSSPPVTDLQYLFERFCENDLDKRLILPAHYEQIFSGSKDYLDKKIITIRMQSLLGGNIQSDLDLHNDYEAGRVSKLTEQDIPALKKLAVIEHFKKLKSNSLASA